VLLATRLSQHLIRWALLGGEQPQIIAAIEAAQAIPNAIPCLGHEWQRRFLRIRTGRSSPMMMSHVLHEGDDEMFTKLTAPSGSGLPAALLEEHSADIVALSLTLASSGFWCRGGSRALNGACQRFGRMLSLIYGLMHIYAQTCLIERMGAYS
jgi:hypothetical protein